MDITPVQSVQSTVTNTQNDQLFESDVADQLDTFLTLLTAQIQNQDPLAPMESTDFVGQLATFSGLEQQVQGNQYLQQMTSLMDTFLGVIASDWMGQTVAIESSFVPFEGEPITYTADIPDNIGQAVFSVRDRDGDMIYSTLIDPEAENWSWNGEAKDGSQVTNDVYQVSIELYEGGNLIGSFAPQLITQVTEVAVENGKLRLGLGNHLTEFAENVQKM